MTEVPLDEDHRQARLIYVLYLAGLIVGVTIVVGVVWAYLARGDGVDRVRTHFRYQMRTFWLAVLYVVIGLALLLVGIGVVVLAAVFLWWIVRCIKGLRQLERRQPVENVETWLF